MKRQAWIWIAPIGLVAGLLLTGPASSAQEGEAETAQTEATGEETAAPKTSPLIESADRRSGAEVKVYTNADLGAAIVQSPRRQRSEAAKETADGKAEPKEGVDPTAGTPAEKDALTWLFEREAAREEHAEKISESEQRIVELRQRVVDLEKRELAIKNPLLARPQPPEEGADEWIGATAPERVAQTQAQIVAAKEALAEAERELSSLRVSAP